MSKCSLLQQLILLFLMIKMSSGCQAKTVELGDIVPIKSYPFVVSVHDYLLEFDGKQGSRMSTKFLCGGCLIKKNYVLTSAYCVTHGHKKSTGRYLVGMGSNTALNFYDVKLSKDVKVHDKFDVKGDREQMYDVALIMLESDAVLKKGVIELAKINHEKDYYNVHNIDATMVAWRQLPVPASRNYLPQEYLRKLAVKTKHCTEGSLLRFFKEKMLISVGEQQPCGYTANGGPLIIDGKVVGLGMSTEVAGKELCRAMCGWHSNLYAHWEWISKNM